MMTATPTECPPPTQLRAYASGRLPETQSDSIFEHLRECESCASALETVDDGEDSLIADLRQPDPLASFADEPGCQTAVAKALAVLANTSELPRQIGEYEVTRPLGRGGMGSVYLARHNKLGRQVALKVLATHRLSDPRMGKRFEAEMRAVGQLSHPNIVTAHDAREVEGTAVLVTEFIDGLDLGQLVQSNGPLGIADACQIIRQVAVALAYIDNQGFVHRDVKPSNIMLSRSGEVKLLDLGLARFEVGDPDHPEIAGPELTGTGQTMGTADYMAPEQVTDSRSVDIRADIYSLGCTLMKLLTGHAPFADEDHETPFAKMTAHVSTPAPRLKQCLPAAPKELASLVDSMLQKDPTKRPQTPMEIAGRLDPFTIGNDLERLGQTEYVPLPVAARSTQTQPTRDRRVPIWVALATGLVGLVVGLVLGITITIEYPDGTKTQVNAPSGSQVTRTETPAAIPRQSKESEVKISSTEALQPEEVGDGPILPDDPLVFIILLDSEEVSDANLNAAKRLLHSQQNSEPNNDKVVVTETGIWIELNDGVAAPIVYDYNGRRYALASGWRANRIEWNELRQHAVSLQSTIEKNDQLGLEFEFDDMLARKFQTMTRNHLRHPLRIVVHGTIRSAPIILSEMNNTVRVVGDFLEEEIHSIVQSHSGGLGDLPTSTQPSITPDDLDRLQGVWISDRIGVAARDVVRGESLMAIDAERIYYFVELKDELISLGTLSLDTARNPSEINMAIRFPNRESALGIYEFESDGRVRLAFKDGKTRPRNFEDIDGIPNLVLRRIGDVPRSPQDFPKLVNRTGHSWLTALSDIVRYQALSLDEVVQSVQARTPEQAITKTDKSMEMELSPAGDTISEFRSEKDYKHEFHISVLPGGSLQYEGSPISKNDLAELLKKLDDKDQTVLVIHMASETKVGDAIKTTNWLVEELGFQSDQVIFKSDR